MNKGQARKKSTRKNTWYGKAILLFVVLVAAFAVKGYVYPQNPPEVKEQKQQQAEKVLTVEERAQRIVQRMTPEQKIGQMVMIGINGTAIDKETQKILNDYQLGNIIFFDRNMETMEQVTQLNRGLKKVITTQTGIEPFIAIDQEGGNVARMRNALTVMPSAAKLGQRDSDETRNCAIETARELKKIGFNVNFAPVADLDLSYSRSYGSTPETVIKYAGAACEGYKAEGMFCSLKHFPGIGGTTLDSHMDRPFFDISYEALSHVDLLPFRSAISHHVAGIMLSHIVYPKLDDTWPASLSPAIVNSLLREKMGYTGVIMTDDLDMGAIKKYIDIETAMDQVLAAQVDQALICHKGPDIERARNRLLMRISAGGIVREKTMGSVERILSLKHRWIG